jgi:hypothetical protein
VQCFADEGGANRAVLDHHSASDVSQARSVVRPSISTGTDVSPR